MTEILPPLSFPDGFQAPAAAVPPVRPSAGNVAVLRQFPEYEPVDPATLQPPLGPSALRLLEEVRGGTDGIADGKLVVDGLLERLGGGVEAHVAKAYGEGMSAVDIYRAVMGGVTSYVSARPPLAAIEGESMVDFALRLRKHQQVEVVAGGHALSLRRTCDGRYEHEVYPLDSWPIAKGYNATGDIDMVHDMVDFYTVRTLRNGYPFNGNRIGGAHGEEPSDLHNYYAGRSQPPTYFYMIRLLGEHGGADVYTHPPYVKAMERLWKHFNPDPALLERQPRGTFHAYRRGGISSDGLPFSVYGDDTNNGREYKDYIGRPESLREDVETARKAASRVAPELRPRVSAETLVHLAAAGEWGWDMTGRQTNGKDLSYTNTTNVVPVELQCMLIDGAEVLATSYRLKRQYAEAQGDMVAATEYYKQELDILDQRAKRLQFVRTHMYNPVTKTFHDLELLEPSASYDSLRSYKGVRQTKVISAATLHTLYSDVTDEETSMSVMEVAERELVGPGGVAVTNIETEEQWDKPNAWATPDRVAVCAPIHAAAKIIAQGGDPGKARALLEFSEMVRQSSLNGSDVAYQLTHTIVETTNAFAPHKRPRQGEYPKDLSNPNTPRNFAMQAEKAVELTYLRVREKFDRLLHVSGRFLIGNS